MSSKRWPLSDSFFWERAPFFRLLVPLIIGITIGYLFLFKPNTHTTGFPTILLFGLIITFTAYSFLAISKNTSSWKGILSSISLNLFIISFGASLIWLSDVRNESTWFGNTLSKGGTYLARINETPAEKESTDKLDVSILQQVTDNSATPTTGRAFVYIYKDEELAFHKGDTILLSANWLPIKNSGNPYEFDYAAYCARNNIFYQQFTSKENIQLYKAANPADASLTERAHDWCMAQLDIYLTNKTTKGLIQAMLLGDEVNLDEHLRQAYSETGIVHVIAISGGNVAIFFIVISWAFWFMRHEKHRWVKYLIALPLVWFYIIMAGAQPSAVRAAIMFTVLAGGFILQKNYSTLNGLFATAVLLLCAQPMWLFSLGFQLSFVAVLSLSLFYEPIYRLIPVRNKISKAIWQTITASIAAELLVAPLVIFYFHLFPVSFIVANIAAYLFMGIVLILGMLIILFSFIAPLAKVLAFLTTGIVTFFDKIVYWLQGLNPTAMSYLRLNTIELLLVYCIIASLAIFFLKKNTKAFIVSLSATCLLLLSFCKNEWVNLHQQRMVVYNMSKANQIDLIQGKQHRILFSATEVANDKRDYTLKPAYTEWQSYDTATSLENEAILIGNKKLLLLNKPAKYYGNFPVDALIVNFPAKFKDIHWLFTTFNPEKLILTSAVKRKEQEKCRQIAEDGNIHAVATDGAYVLEAIP